VQIFKALDRAPALVVGTLWSKNDN